MLPADFSREDSSADGCVRKKILLVEDEALIAMGEARLLDEHGFDVRTVYHAEKAIEEIRSGAPDLILMDIDLGAGKMDGTEAAEIILKEAEIPIVFLSSHTEPEVVERTEKITSYGYIVKNSGDTVLIASIKMAFRLFEAHAQLRQKELENRELVENIDSAIIRFDTAGIITYFSKGAERIFGYSAEEVLGRRSVGTINPHRDNRGCDHETLLKEIISHPENFNQNENENIRKDGTPIFMSWTNKMVYDESGCKLYIQAIGNDITGRRQIEEELRKTKERFKKTFLSIPDAVFILSGEEPPKIVECNPAACRVFGYSREEMLGRTTLFLQVDEEAPRAFQNHLYPAVEDHGSLSPNDFQMKAKDGSILSTEHRVIPLQDDEGNRTGWVSVIRETGGDSRESKSN